MFGRRHTGCRGLPPAHDLPGAGADEHGPAGGGGRYRRSNAGERRRRIIAIRPSASPIVVDDAGGLREGGGSGKNERSERQARTLYTARPLGTRNGVRARGPRSQAGLTINTDDLGLYTERFLQYAGPDVVVGGHWNDADVSDDGWPSPRMGTWTIGIDTSKHGVVTALQLPEQRVFQSARYVR